MRKAEREVAPLRFELHTDDRSILETLVAWKGEHYVRTNLGNIFEFPWTGRLVEKSFDVQTEGFLPLLSVLYLGDHLGAMMLSLRSYETAFGWFTSYNTEFSKYGPGQIMYLKLIEGLAEAGVQRYDLGPGLDTYKSAYVSGTMPVAGCAVDRFKTRRVLRETGRRTIQWVKASPLKGPATVPWQLTRRFREWLAYR